MIIFDLDGTLADCEHRRHFVDRNHPENFRKIYGNILNENSEHPSFESPWKPDWESFYEDCDKDKPIHASIELFCCLWDKYISKIQIWSGRCESVRRKTEKWLLSYGMPVGSYIKMRRIGDNTPDDQLKERWLEQTYEETKWGRRSSIDFVFDNRTKAIRMWRSHGIFVFNCCQNDKEF